LPLKDICKTGFNAALRKPSDRIAPVLSGEDIARGTLEAQPQSISMSVMSRL